MAFSAVVLCSLLATASGAASLADIIDVPHAVVYQKGTLGAGSTSLLEGESSQERQDAMHRMSSLLMEVKEQILEDGKAEIGLLAPQRKPTVVASALEREGLSGAFEMLEEHNQPELRKALSNAMKFKEQKSIDHMTLEETLVKQELLKEQLNSAGQAFANLFDATTVSYVMCQQCLRDCPARNFEPYGVRGSNKMYDCMKGCELVICKETWNPLAGSYIQQLSAFANREQGMELLLPEKMYAKPTIFTNYLDLKKQSMFYEDEDEDTEIVYDAPTKEQLEQAEEHDSTLTRFLFVLDESHHAGIKKVPHFDLRRVSNKQARVLAMEAPEDEAAQRLSMTAREAEIIAKSQAFGVPAEWIPGMDFV